MNMEVLKHQFTKIERLKYLVDNEWRESKTAKFMPVMDPSTGKQIAEAPLVAIDAVEQGGFFRRLWDSLVLWWKSR